jgi:hypothetical protein
MHFLSLVQIAPINYLSLLPSEAKAKRKVTREHRNL